MITGSITSSGFSEVQKELKRIREAQAPAMAKAIASAAKFGERSAIDAIHKQYGFKSKSYIEQHFSYSVNPKTLEGRVSARYRPSTLNRFSTPKGGISKAGRARTIGHNVNVIRNTTVWFKGAFTVLGKNGNQLMFLRSKGDNSWRSLKGQKVKYGPSVSGSFGVLRDEIEPPVIRHLRETYGRHAK